MGKRKQPSEKKKDDEAKKQKTQYDLHQAENADKYDHAMVGLSLSKLHSLFFQASSKNTIPLPARQAFLKNFKGIVDTAFETLEHHLDPYYTKHKIALDQFVAIFQSTADNWFLWLSQTEIFNLALVCSKTFEFFGPQISSRYSFHYMIKFNIYRPDNLIYHKGTSRDIPDYCKHVIVTEATKIDKFPIHVTRLTLWPRFDTSIESYLPSTLTHLQFGVDFNQPVDNLLPHGLKHLTFGYEFNQPVDHLPPGLTHLTLGEMYDGSVDYLPKSLLVLKLGGSYQEPLDHLPDSLQILEIDDYAPFNHPIEYLPPSLQELKLSALFNNPIGDLPTGLTRLNLGRAFDHEISILPKGLVSLTLGGFTNAIKNLPPTLRHFQVGIPNSNFTFKPKQIPELPASVTTLVGDYFTKKQLSQLPRNLQNLHFINKFDLPLPSLPDSLRVLKLSTEFNQSIQELPPNLEQLHLGQSFDRPLEELPNKLQVLILGASFSHKLPALPESLKELRLGESYTHSLSLPSGLEIYYGGGKSYLPTLPNTLITLDTGRATSESYLYQATSLVTLYVGVEYEKPLYELPDSLITLCIRRSQFTAEQFNFWQRPKNLRKFRTEYYNEHGQMSSWHEEHFYPLNDLIRTQQKV